MKIRPKRAWLVPLAALAVLAIALGAGALSAGRGTSSTSFGPVPRGVGTPGRVTTLAGGVGAPSGTTAAAAQPASGFGQSGPVAVRGPDTAPQPAPGQAAPQPIPVPRAFSPDQQLILTANVALRADDAWSIADRVQAIATGLGGDVMQMSQSGSKDQRSATLTIRVPEARFDDALAQVRAISDVEVVSSNVNGQDVTDQFVDLQARLKAKQDEEQRYLALLARADKVDDIIKIDAVLSQVRTQIEQLTGQVDSIKARTTYSTISVSISPLVPGPAPVPGPLAYDPSKTFQRAVTALVSMLRGAIDLAIWAAVFAWIPLVLFGLALVLGRVRGRALPSA